jgi:hypothetical protein
MVILRYKLSPDSAKLFQRYFQTLGSDICDASKLIVEEDVTDTESVFVTVKADGDGGEQLKRSSEAGLLYHWWNHSLVSRLTGQETLAN